MALTTDELETIKRLQRKIEQDAAEFKRLDSYYAGAQRLDMLGLAVPPELERFTTIVAWPAMAADGVEERLDIEGFRLPGTDEADEDLWRVWQANSLDGESQLGHLDSLIYSRSFVCVGAGEDEDTPLVTVESPKEIAAESDPRTRACSAALRVYCAREGDSTKLGTLYLPDVTVWLRRDRGGWVEDPDLGRDEHGLGVVPVVALTNRARVADRAGKSEMQAVISLTDAAARSLTNLQIAQETHAVPQRGVLGASKGDFIGSDDKPLTTWEAYFGAVWALENANAKTFQFSASDLRNFETTIQLYARLASGVSALPPNYFGLAADDAASADAIRSREARLVKRCERKIRALSEPWELVMRLVRRIQDGDWDPDLKRMETLWRDPATPTRAQQADAVVKLVQAGILPREAGWEDLGYSATRRQRLKAMLAEEDAAGLAQILKPPAAVPAVQPAVPVGQ